MIHAYRDRPIPTPIDIAVIKRIGITESLAPRTHQALRLLDLLDASSQPTPAMEGLRKAGADEFPARLADVVRAAYAEVFAYRDPATDDVSKIEDAFRDFKPVGMRPRMVRLFLGLCEAAGIIESAAPVSRGGAKPARGKKRDTEPRKTGNTAVKRPQQAAPQKPAHQPARSYGGGGEPGGVAAQDHLMIRGLLQTLPPVGAVFSDEQRKEWAAAAVAAFNLIYVRPPEDSVARSKLSATSEGGGNV